MQGILVHLLRMVCSCLTGPTPCKMQSYPLPAIIFHECQVVPVSAWLLLVYLLLLRSLCQRRLRCTLGKRKDLQCDN